MTSATSTSMRPSAPDVHDLPQLRQGLLSTCKRVRACAGAPEAHEHVHTQVRQKLMNTRKRMEDLLAHVEPSTDDAWYEDQEELLKPLRAVYWCVGNNLWGTKH